MPIISFTPADALAGIMLEAGNYPAEIVEIDGPRNSSTQKSVGFWTKFHLTEGAFKGKELRICYNTGTTSNSLLGDMQFAPHSDLLKVEAAIKKTKVEVVARPDFNTDFLLHKPLVLAIGVSPKDDGSLGQFISGYLPAGTSNKIPF
jgi:hypothetical protein